MRAIICIIIIYMHISATLLIIFRTCCPFVCFWHFFIWDLHTIMLEMIPIVSVLNLLFFYFLLKHVYLWLKLFLSQLYFMHYWFRVCWETVLNRSWIHFLDLRVSIQIQVKLNNLYYYQLWVLNSNQLYFLSGFNNIKK